MVTPLSVQGFDISTLRLGTPGIIAGGVYFIKFSINNLPVYVQTPLCKTKQGIVKSGKKAFCDLCIRQDEEDFVTWTETVEQHARDIIFAHRDDWFQNSLDKHDIENYFSPIMKYVKASRIYTLRANVPTPLGECVLKIYNENREVVSHDDIVAASNVAAVIELKGIRCSARSFAIDIEIKQMMVMDDTDPFEQCVINVRPAAPAPSRVHASSPAPVPAPTPAVSFIENIDDDSGTDFTKGSIAPKLCMDTAEMSPPPPPPPPDMEDTEIDTDDIIEIMVDTEFDDTPIHLNRRGDIHKDLYRSARSKAKIALDLAISAHAEAVRIKQMYLMTAVDEDDEIGPLPEYPPN